MGLLDRFFRRKPTFESQGDMDPSTEPTEEKKEKKEGVDYIAGELSLSPEEIHSEVEDGPRTVEAMHYKFGKLVQNKDGPIVTGYEHNVTGIPEQMSDRLDLFPRMLKGPPDIFFPYKSSRHEDEYAWPGEGEIIKKMIDVGGLKFMVCARKETLSEGGKGVQDRGYNEMDALLIPQKDWSVAVIPQLADLLQVKALSGKQQELPAVEIDTGVLDKPLDPEWFDQDVKDIVGNIVSGQSINVQERTSQKEFLDRLFRAMICLPEHIAQRVSFGAGLHGMEGNAVRVAQNQMSFAPIKRIGNKWTGDGLTSENQQWGQQYLDAITPLIADCKTPREIMRAIKDLPPEIIAECEKRFTIDKS
ncbi:hypothetical protein ACFL0Z_00905 [Patescibacteria group bacterium]